MCILQLVSTAQNEFHPYSKFYRMLNPAKSRLEKYMNDLSAVVGSITVDLMEAGPEISFTIYYGIDEEVKTEIYKENLEIDISGLAEYVRKIYKDVNVAGRKLTHVSKKVEKSLSDILA